MDIVIRMKLKTPDNVMLEVPTETAMRRTTGVEEREYVCCRGGLEMEMGERIKPGVIYELHFSRRRPVDVVPYVCTSGSICGSRILDRAAAALYPPRLSTHSVYSTVYCWVEYEE